MIPHSQELGEILNQLNTDVEHGLTEEEARGRLARYGYNKLQEKKGKGNLQRFIEQFHDVMILILLVAAAISFIVSIYEKEGFIEPLLIVLIVFLNALMGVIQESKAEKALDALKNLSAPHARVIRDGEQKMVPAIELVPGDIILLEEGDYVPADARLVESVSLKSEESALTGESAPVEKNASVLIPEDAPVGDRANMMYSGCGVAYGRGKAVVTSTGMATEMGKIAELLAGGAQMHTPLQLKLAVLGKYLGIAAILACVVIFILGLIDGIHIMEIFMISVSLAVSAIPEGLPAIVTIVLAIGVQRMVKQNAIIRRLPAVETLGSASVICSDKTGTLTQNQMTLTHAYVAEGDLLEEISEDNHPTVKNLLFLATLCCNGKILVKNGDVQHLGDPTETAIIFAAHKNGMPQSELEKNYPRLAEVPFDSERKLMSTINRVDGKNLVIVKGAFDVLIKRCMNGDLEVGRERVEALSKDALRILAVAYKEIEEVPQVPTSDNLEKDLTFLGFVGMIDPPRPETRQAVAICLQAGIKPVMITGDHVLTASAIAKDLGILTEGDEVITGQELVNMTDDELDQKVRDISVYARVSPTDKIRIVRAWQNQGEVVAMTGDGVNDAPALQAADIGCAMGITGTDVAKGAADMTLTDDNFATIVEAVREGRGIYDNIRKVVGFLLGTNVGEILTVFFAMLFWKQSPLISMQLLWINLVTDSLPAIALGMEPVEGEVMNRKPKPKNEGIFAHGLGVQVLLQGVMFAGLTLIGFMLGWKSSGDLMVGRTMAFIILASTQIIHSFNMRSNHSLFRIGPFTNKPLTYAALGSSFLIALVLFIPEVTIAFGLVQLSGEQYLISLALAFVPLVVLEITKGIGVIKHHNR